MTKCYKSVSYTHLDVYKRQSLDADDTAGEFELDVIDNMDEVEQNHIIEEIDDEFIENDDEDIDSLDFEDDADFEELNYEDEDFDV